jgi:Protein of unknown function (DUF2778)
MASAQAFSGTGPFQNNPNYDFLPSIGSIPTGVYDILYFTPNPDWYRLDIRDSIPLNDQYDDAPFVPGFPRSQFRLHPGRVSLGCVTVPKDNVKDWNNIVRVISKTKTSLVEDRFGIGGGISNAFRAITGKIPRQPLPMLKNYGTLFVLP